MLEYWPSFLCVFIDQDEAEDIYTHKKNEANILPSSPNRLGQMIKGFIINNGH